MSNSTTDNLVANLNTATFWINRIIPVISIVFGTFGNLFNIIIFTRRSLCNNPCSVYFLAGSIANFFVMYVALLTRYLATSWNLDPAATNMIWCKIRYFLIYPPLCLVLWGCCVGGGYFLVANDIAPAYAGIVFGISNTLATIPGIVSPYVVGALTEKVCLIPLKY
ncbi:unnamed protein product [Rotaria sp. Silwood1]|nr:unnamed protein product [Rotaria sp. Silwood1]